MPPEGFTSGRRAMAIWLPAWPIDLLRRRDRRSRESASAARPILLFAAQAQRQVVVHCCERAQKAGVRAGLPLAQARALFPADAVRLEADDPPRRRAALRSLAAWAQRFSPAVAVDEDGPGEPDGLLLDVSGCERVFGGEARLLRQARGDLAGLGFQSRAAVAPTFACAWALSRFGDGEAIIVEPGGQRGAIAPLPVEALRLSAETTAELAEIGIVRIAHLLELPRSTLPARFGEELLRRLDRALGQAIETIEPVRPIPPPAVERCFDGPTAQMEAVELTVRDLLARLADALLQRECGARRIEVELVRSDLPPEHLTITLGRPSREVKHLWTLLRPKLERAHLGFGVEAVRLRAASIGRLPHEQAEHWREGEPATAAQVRRAGDELLDALGNRLGAARVQRAMLRESHLPERAFVLRPAIEGISGSEACAGLTPRDRPTLLFEHPLEAQVVSLTPDGPVHRVQWRGGGGEIVCCLGPERLEPEWWRTPPGRGAARDCFAVQEQSGRWLWLMRQHRDGEPDQWSIHGAWA